MPRKPEPDIVPSDDYVYRRGGVEYHPHEGESVTIFRGSSVGEWKSRQALLRLNAEMKAAEGDPDEQTRTSQLLEAAYDDLTEALVDRIVSWTWTNAASRPLPQPDGSVKVLQRLNANELYYLFFVVAVGETTAEAKKDEKQSPIT